MNRMDGCQFEQFCNLLKLCEEKGLDISTKHRIASEVWYAANQALALERYMGLVSSGKCPFTSGIPKKMTLVSCAEGYGPLPPDDEEVEQKLTINDRGAVFITYYNTANSTLRKERKRVPSQKTQMLLRDISLAFSTRWQNVIALDAGFWNMKITNTEGRSFSFDGALLPDEDAELSAISDAIRDLLDDTGLYCFDGKTGECIQFVSVEFEPDGKEYCYRAHDKSLRIGELVRVPVGNDGRTSDAVIVDIKFGTEEDAPFPIERIKDIIGRKLPPMPDELHGSVYEMVKTVVDALDYMGLLEMGAPDDEYDIESKAIADLIKPGMTTEEIADIMAKEMARSFAEPYRLEPFLAPAQILHNALESQGEYK